VQWNDWGVNPENRGGGGEDGLMLCQEFLSNAVSPDLREERTWLA